MIKTPRSSLLPLALILALFAVLHGLYNWATPLGEGPDEPGHVAYVLFLAFERRLPVQRPPPALSDVPGEGHQPPLAYLLAATLVAWLPPEERELDLQPNPDFVWVGGDAPGAFVRASRELWPWEGLALAWHLARGASGLAGAATVALSYLAARRLLPHDRLFAPLTALLVALHPQLLFMSALVTNDALLAALGAALLWHSLARPVARYGWAWCAGLLFGLALLTKQSALLLGPLLLWATWRISGGAWRIFLGMSLRWIAMALLVAGWWHARNLWLYGDPFGLSLFQQKFSTQAFVWNDSAAWQAALRQLFGSYWARFGWMNIHPPAWMLWVYALFTAGALLGLGRRWWQQGLAVWHGPLLALALAGLWTMAFVATAGLVAWQGRMLFPALAAVALLLAGGMIRTEEQRNRGTGGQGGRGTGVQRNRGTEEQRNRRTEEQKNRGTEEQRNRGAGGQRVTPGLVGLLGLLGLLAFWMPLGVIRPAYTWEVLGPREAQAALGQPSYARFAASWEQGVVLRGWAWTAPLRPGEEVGLRLTWQSLEAIPRPWTVFVHLVDEQELIVAQSNRQPRDAGLPFPRWTRGDWVDDTHWLNLPADLPPGTYRLRVGLFLPDAGGRRQLVWDAQGELLGDLVELGMVEVVGEGAYQLGRHVRQSAIYNHKCKATLRLSEIFPQVNMCIST
ncbi:hypothetical protein [Candidatus Viridilinea mediisalina]|uniref:Uncharacterized protein n=1 Tax=Candidatus Viridilinea mediisalina TaxID=2024553 RepID=A0A2A6RHQ9_9CHLR|nr:hypothetical protein [Candidatus Viridilinea mediisalina]PDW02408.1 hypothetical protein CJ255_14140 [Candidatus Viridilinea mediisalina]